MGYFNNERWICPTTCGIITKKKKEFVTEQFKELLLTGCVTKVNRADIHFVSPLRVVKNSIKKRLILDLRLVNKVRGHSYGAGHF